MRQTVCLIMFAAFVQLFSLAHAQETSCDARLENIGQTTYTVDRGGYDPFAPATQSEEITVRLSPGSVSGSCSLALAVRSSEGDEGSDRKARSAHGGILTYRISVDPNGQTPLFSSMVPDARSLAPIALRGEVSQTSDVEIYFAPVQTDPSQGAIRSGDYRQDVQFELYEISGTIPNLIDSVAAQIIIPVVLVSEIRVSNQPIDFESAASSTILDFGELEAGNEQSAYLSLRSTSPYHLEFMSQNAWAMTSELGGLVGYAMYLDGAQVATGSNSQIVKAPSWVASTGSHELRFQVRGFGVQPAGVYRDIIRIRMISAQ